ncbi:MAG: methyltransferase domain-containing protein [Hyphomicrobiaceae bacterium]|nr:methyltransferase domain-containing protein [Hyphomicrobiaceae bacterium]
MVATDQDIFDRDLLMRRRDRVAAGAGLHDFLLARVADDLIERLGAVQRRFPVAVELGAYHGLLGRRLRQVPGIGLVVQTEPAWRLLEQCDGVRVQANEEALPFRDQSLDLVTSGLSLQFVNDLPGTFVQIRRALKPDGLFLAALLGGRTLSELRNALLAAEEEIEGGASPRVAPFAELQDFGALLQRANFALPVVDADTLTVTYPDALALMRELRGMGATNALKARRRRPLRRATLGRASSLYQERFGLSNGRVPATFEIITLTAWAPHENQQRPLAPGTATHRLADALGTVELPTGDPARRLPPGR